MEMYNIIKNTIIYFNHKIYGDLTVKITDFNVFKVSELDSRLIYFVTAHHQINDSTIILKNDYISFHGKVDDSYIKDIKCIKFKDKIYKGKELKKILLETKLCK